MQYEGKMGDVNPAESGISGPRKWKDLELTARKALLKKYQLQEEMEMRGRNVDQMKDLGGSKSNA